MRKKNVGGYTITFKVISHSFTNFVFRKFKVEVEVGFVPNMYLYLCYDTLLFVAQVRLSVVF